MIAEHKKSSDYHEIAKEEYKAIERIELFEKIDEKDVKVELEQFHPGKDRVVPTELVQTEEDRKQILDTQSGKINILKHDLKKILELYKNLAIKTDLGTLEKYLDMLIVEIKGINKFLTIC